MWIRLLVWIGIPFVCICSILAVLSATGRASLRQAMEEARADGRPVTFEEIQAERRTWADEDNGALIIVKLVSRLDQINKATSQSPIPCLGEGKLPKLGRRWTKETDGLVVEELDRRAAELSELDRLADFEGGRFPLDIKPNPYTTLLPHLAPMRSAARLKCLQINQRAMQGELTSLSRDFDVMFGISRLVDDEPMLISVLVGMAVDALTVDTIQRVCGQGVPNAALLKHIEGQITKVELAKRMYWAMLGERATFVGASQWMEAGGPGGSISTDMLHYPMIPGAGGVFYRDQAAGLRIYNRYVEAAQDTHLAIEVTREIEGEIASLPIYCVFTRILMPSLSRAFALELRGTGRIRSARAALAAERYRIDHGQWPADLGELVPGYLDAVPLDPFDDEPLRYLRNEEGIVVYSIGDDLTDDGGELERAPSQNEAGDFGFTLLDPSRRGLPPEPPSTSSAPSP